MSTYTAPDRVRRFLPLDIDGATFADAELNEYITTWSGYVDDYLNSVYKVPFPDYPSTPPMITQATEWLVVYDLYIRSGMATDKEDGRLSLWKRSHEILDKIKTREITLTGTGTLTISEPAIVPTGPALGPLSFQNQNQNLGGPHTKASGSIPLAGYPDEVP